MDELSSLITEEPAIRAADGSITVPAIRAAEDIEYIGLRAQWAELMDISGSSAGSVLCAK